MQRITPDDWFNWSTLVDEPCYTLSNEQLTDSPLARLAVDKGYSSLTSFLNECSAWKLTVGELTALLNEPAQ